MMTAKDFKEIIAQRNDKRVQIIGPMPINKELVDEIPTIFVDGGINHQLSLTGPIISIGDNDSNNTSSELDIILPKEKDISDLVAALDLLPESIEEASLYGFLGGRKDHEFANFIEIASYLEKQSQLTIDFNGKIISYSKGEYNFNHQGHFSVFSFSNHDLKLFGDCKYQIDGQIKPLSSHGLSNLAFGNCSLELELGSILIFLED